MNQPPPVRPRTRIPNLPTLIAFAFLCAVAVVLGWHAGQLAAR